ncbi:hypothetical protein [Paraburkholderia rhizosphaerae]|uniref:Uncharacterized protein n=1 Tax=Paraburkholderia rhizosphaerae TaxID=480658 RepID=A0A4V3HFP3_9BURK|nr:hypothetical protein [Paraburkholderia rhizosphaerae]TDY54199.1 hypothetical protein BX592_102346 [Paraburkholderia rhizosphaerae]
MGTNTIVSLTVAGVLAVGPFAASMAMAAGDVCGTLSGTDADAANAANAANAASGASPVSGFHVREGEPVNLLTGGKTTPGTLHVYADNGVYRLYWQPEGRVERYVLANAGPNAVRLIAMPTQGVPARNGEPGTMLAPQQVLSCPML